MKILSGVLTLALHAGVAAGCCGDGNDDEKDRPDITIQNETPHYLHIFHPDEVFTYVAPGTSVSLSQDRYTGELLVAVAPGQGPAVKASGPLPQPPPAGGTCSPYRIQWVASSSTAPFRFVSNSCSAPSSGSCPYVYSQVADGGHRIEGEALVGALNRGAARRDALVLRRATVREGRICVRLAAVLRERDVIDEVGLELIEHEAKTEVFLTPELTPLVLRALAPPDALLEGERRRPVTGERRSWTSALPSGNGTHDELHARFGAGALAAVALRVRNTRFVEEAYHDFMRRLGPGLPRLMRIGSRFSLYRSLLDGLTRRAGLPLTLELEGREVSSIPPVGRAAPREVALTIPKGTGASGLLVLRALAGAWEVSDLRGTVAAPERPHARRRLQLITAHLGSRSSKARAIPLEPLSQSDGESVALEQGQHLDLCFAAPARSSRAGMASTAVLHLSGHYELLDESFRPCLNLGTLKQCLLSPEPRFASYVRDRLRAGRRSDGRARPRSGDGGAR